MIEENDRIAIGVSGGKDSLTLLVVIQKIEKRERIICLIRNLLKEHYLQP
jgi:tRNA(Ile)-lysidine synthase TilS/MesJ